VILEIIYIEAGYSSANTLYLVTDKGVVRYDVVSGNVEVLYSFDSNYRLYRMAVDTLGRAWFGLRNGVR
jgi:ligand-binding sensor domain-containing protein